MCFEWDERYYRELAERLSKEKVDALIKHSEEAARASLMNDAPESNATQPAANLKVPTTA